MKSIKDFIFYFRSCPLCENWITLDADLPIPSMIELQSEGLLLTLVKDKHEDNKEFFISYKQNKVSSKHPFVLNNIESIIKRLYLSDYSETFKLEARCYSCNNFRYWSKPMVYSRKSQRLKNIAISGEKIQLHETLENNEQVSYTIFNNYNTNDTTTTVIIRTQSKYSPDRQQLEFSIPFLPFSKLNFSNRNEIIADLNKLSVLV